MRMKLNITAIALLLLLESQLSEADVYDVTKYGAEPDGKTDLSQPLLGAWKAACAATTASSVLIPAGKYLLGQISMAGPCKAPINLIVKGTLLSPVDTSKFKADDGWVSFLNVNDFTMSGNGVFDGQGKTIWGQNCGRSSYCRTVPMNLRFNYLTNAIITGVTTKDSKQFHVNVLGCKNLTFSHFTVSAPAESLNTDGIHIGRSSGIYILDSTIQTGDDCVSIGDGSEQIHVENVNCGPGHGISVGSLGRYPHEQPVSGIFVKHCTFTGTQNGVRIKTWPASPKGIATDMHFEDLTMDNVGNPILIDQEYCPYNQCKLQIPSLVKISNVSFKNIHGTTSTELAVKLICSPGIPCQDVQLADINLVYKGGKAISQCKNIMPMLSGEQVPKTCA